ncbi:MAG: T9SS type A sorting domain-containing protein [Polaribacter sp.]|nr:T9SS type A sorting domain-containing protein [Polaribacter sp.]
MKKIITLLTVFYCVTINSQKTSITDATIKEAVSDWASAPAFAEVTYGNISIYPNPVVDKLFIQGLSDASKVFIYNILGKLVISKITSKEIDADNLQSGIYIVKIVDEQKEIVKKFIKK